MTTVREIIDAILHDFFGDDDYLRVQVGNNIGIKYDRFVKILCRPEKPMFVSRRTIREKWNLLHDLGYLTKVNQFASKMEFQRILDDFYRS